MNFETELNPDTKKISNEEITHSSTEELIEGSLKQLSDSLDKQTIKTSEGIDIILHVTRDKMTTTNEEMWYVTFEYEHNGRVANHKYPTNNYISLSVVPDTNTIEISSARLETMILKGKNVYPQVIQLISQNFPNDFGLESEFGHDKTKRDILDARTEYQEGKIEINELKEKILHSYLFEVRIAAGFNCFELSFTLNYKGDTFLKVKSKKDDDTDHTTLTLVGL